MYVYVLTKQLIKYLVLHHLGAVVVLPREVADGQHRRGEEVVVRGLQPAHHREVHFAEPVLVQSMHCLI